MNSIRSITTVDGNILKGGDGVTNIRFAEHPELGPCYYVETYGNRGPCSCHRGVTDRIVVSLRWVVSIEYLPGGDADYITGG